MLTGADPAFCAGVDLKELAAGGDNLHSRAVDYLTGSPVPVIAAVNGPSVTGGLELALACDFRIASERATFADTHARVGIVPGWGLTVRLPKAVGAAFAREMSFTGNYVDAATALRVGLVNHVVAHDDLLPTARALAADVASCVPEAVRSCAASTTPLPPSATTRACASSRRPTRPTACAWTAPPSARAARPSPSAAAPRPA